MRTKVWTTRSAALGLAMMGTACLSGSGQAGAGDGASDVFDPTQQADNCARACDAMAACGAVTAAECEDSLCQRVLSDDCADAMVNATCAALEGGSEVLFDTCFPRCDASEVGTVRCNGDGTATACAAKSEGNRELTLSCEFLCGDQGRQWTGICASEHEGQPRAGFGQCICDDGGQPPISSVGGGDGDGDGDGAQLPGDGDGDGDGGGVCWDAADVPSGATHGSCPAVPGPPVLNTGYPTCCGCLSDEFSNGEGDWDNGFCCGDCTAVCGDFQTSCSPFNRAPEA